MKLKTHKGLQKRVKITGRGKILFRKSSKQHLLINKSKRQKALQNSGKQAHPSDEKKIRLLLPYL